MHSVFLVLVSLLGAARGASYYRETLEAALLPHKFERGFCYDLAKGLKQSQIDAKCRPRETMIDLLSESPHILIFPNKAPVKRCDGGDCYGQSSCLPIHTEEVSIVVRKHDFHTRKEWCGVIRVEQHTSCKCGCSIRKHHCGPKHEYLPNECMCACKNTDEKAKCLTEGRIWDSGTCSCNCAFNSECSTGTEWVPSLCRCMRVVVEDEEDGSPKQEDNGLSFVLI